MPLNLCFCPAHPECMVELVLLRNTGGRCLSQSGLFGAFNIFSKFGNSVLDAIINGRIGGKSIKNSFFCPRAWAAAAELMPPPPPPPTEL
jgi:hypothetical protein